MNDALAAILAAERGEGLTTALSYMVAPQLAAGTLVRVLDAFAPPPVPVQLVYPQSGLVAAKVRAFIDFAAPRLARALAPASRLSLGLQIVMGAASGRWPPSRRDAHRDVVDQTDLAHVGRGQQPGRPVGDGCQRGQRLGVAQLDIVDLGEAGARAAPRARQRARPAAGRPSASRAAVAPSTRYSAGAARRCSASR